MYRIYSCSNNNNGCKNHGNDWRQKYLNKCKGSFLLFAWYPLWKLCANVRDVDLLSSSFQIFSLYGTLCNLYLSQFGTYLFWWKDVCQKFLRWDLQPITECFSNIWLYTRYATYFKCETWPPCSVLLVIWMTNQLLISLLHALASYSTHHHQHQCQKTRIDPKYVTCRLIHFHSK